MDKVNLPLVSVIIPTYNRIHTLPTSIRSVLDQTYLHLELLIIDDGSDDGTEEYVRSIIDTRVRYWKNDVNMGPSASRNRGAELAAGEYLAFQDSDDEWRPDKLEKQMKQMLADKETSMVYCEFGLYLKGEVRLYIPPREMPYVNKCGNLFPYLLRYPLISTQTIVVDRREFIKENGFNTTLRAYEDFEFTLRYARNHRIGFVAEPLVKVNSSPGSVNKRFEERIHAQFFMVREMLEPLRSRGLLWDKLGIIQHEAESHDCHDIFLKEITDLSREVLHEEEKENAELIKEKVRHNYEVMRSKQFFQENIPEIRKNLFTIYEEQCVNRDVWSDRQHETVKGILDTVHEYGKLLMSSDEMADCYEKICSKMKDVSLSWTEQLYMLADVVELLELLEKCILDQR